MNKQPPLERLRKDGLLQSQTLGSDEDKMRLSATVDELRNEKEVFLNSVMDFKSRIRSMQEGSEESVVESDNLREEKMALEAENRQMEVCVVFGDGRE